MNRKTVDERHVHTAQNLARCPACNMARLEKDGEGSFCPNCLYTPSPPITIEAAVAKAEAVAVAESRALRDELAREHAQHNHNRRRAA